MSPRANKKGLGLRSLGSRLEFTAVWWDGRDGIGSTPHFVGHEEGDIILINLLLHAFYSPGMKMCALLLDLH